MKVECDTSEFFCLGTEQYVGEAIRESGIPREEIFVITKLPSVFPYFISRTFTFEGIGSLRLTKIIVIVERTTTGKSKSL